MVSSKRTRKFDVSNTGMVDLPAQIEQMTWLKDLNLCDNGLVRLPPQISTLNLVEHLNLARNRLTTLPKEIGGMRMLRSLDITGNKIRALPLELGLCKVRARARDLGLSSAFMNHRDVDQLALLKPCVRKPDHRHAMQDLRELHYEEQMIVMPAKEVLNLGVRAMTIYLRRLREAIQYSKLALTGMTLAQVSFGAVVVSRFEDRVAQSVAVARLGWALADTCPKLTGSVSLDVSLCAKTWLPASSDVDLLT